MGHANYFAELGPQPEGEVEIFPFFSNSNAICIETKREVIVCSLYNSPLFAPPINDPSGFVCCWVKGQKDVRECKSVRFLPIVVNESTLFFFQK